MTLGIVDRFRERVPGDILEALVDRIHQGNREAANELRHAVQSGKYGRGEARDVFPHTRRAHVETRLTTLPDDFPGLTVQSRSSHGPTGSATGTDCSSFPEY